MDLLEYHFSRFKPDECNLVWNQSDNTYEMFGKNGGKRFHLNYLTFKELFRHMISMKDPIILETGIASAGTNSTYLFNEYIRRYGGRLWSVDLNKKLVDSNKGNMCPATTLVHDDSVHFLNEWVKNNSEKQADVVYLDSYDLDWYNPEPAGIHGLNEYNALIPVLKKNSLLLIDDTPSSPDWLDTRGKLYEDMVKYYNNNNHTLPGKGMYVLKENKTANMLMHNYQVLYKY